MSGRTSLISKTFDTWKSRLIVWLLLSLAYLPFIGAAGFTRGEDSASFLFVIAGVITLFLFFAAFCFASLAYFVDKSVPISEIVLHWWREISSRMAYFVRLFIRLILVIWLTMIVAMLPFLPFIFIVAEHWEKGQPIPSGFFAILAGWLLLSSLWVVRYALSPQIAMVGRTGYTGIAKDTVNESVEMVKRGYAEVLSMFLPPLVLFGGGSLLIALLRVYDRANRWLVLPYILGLAFFDGAAFSFIAAGFSEYFKETHKVGMPRD